MTDRTTRLISRNRFRLPSLAARLGMVATEAGSLVMERKMLLGTKQRAEALARAREADAGYRAAHGASAVSPVISGR